MSFEWIQFLNLARELKGGQFTQPSNPEAKDRTAASRAYYSVRGLALDYALDNGARDGFSKYNQGDLWNWYIQHTDRDLQKVGQELKTLYSLRRKADYYDTVRGVEDNAYTAILLAESIQAALG